MLLLGEKNVEDMVTCVKLIGPEIIFLGKYKLEYHNLNILSLFLGVGSISQYSQEFNPR